MFGYLRILHSWWYFSDIYTREGSDDLFVVAILDYPTAGSIVAETYFILFKSKP